MRFENPQVLWLLLVFPPALMAFFWWSRRKSRELMSLFIESRLLPGLVAGLSPARQKFRLGSLVLAVSCLILALARPQWGFAWEEVKQRGLDIIVAVDTSKSMLAEDIKPNRLARAKLAAMDLLQEAKTDRLGLLAFAGSAFLVCPLTIDDAAFRHCLDALDTNTISQGGTALADAIQTALTAFEQEDNHKVLVILTDGEDHDSGASEAAKKAAEAGLQIFTIGIGSTEGELLRIRQPNGQSDYIRDAGGNVVKSRLNESLLREIAGETERGFYLPLRPKTMETLYEKGLAPLPKSDSAEKLVKHYYERFHWPLGLAILLLVIEMFFPERKRAPRQAPSRQLAKPLATAAVSALVLMACLQSAKASSSTALRDYKAGEYKKALRQYKYLLQEQPDDPRLHFNAGAAAYRSQQFDEAEKHFDEALKSPDLELQEKAYYNRGNTRYWLGDQQADPQKKTAAWQEAVKDFESSLKLNPADADAKHNQDYVRQLLEELKQQQQQQDKSNQDRKQDQQQQQQQASQQEQQNQQNQQSQNEQQQQQGQQEQQQAQQQPQPEEQNQPSETMQPEQQQQQAAEQNEQEQQAAAKQDEQHQEEETGAAAAPGQMTPDQARQLLDSQKGEEQMMPIQPEGKPHNTDRPFRDW